MDRREYLVTIAMGGLAGLAGCPSGSQDGGTKQPDSDDTSEPGSRPTSTPTVTASPTSTAQPTETVRPGSLDAGNTYETVENIALTVERVQARRSIANADRRVDAGTDRAFVVAHVTVANEGDGAATLPNYDTFALLSGSDQYEAVVPEVSTGDYGVEQPIEGVIEPGELYERVEDAHPGVDASGWILFEVPRSVAQVEIAWAEPSYLERTESVTWATSVDMETLPALAVSDVKIEPTPTRLATETTVTVTVENTGGSKGTFQTRWTVNLPTGAERADTLSVDVPGNKTETWSMTVKPAAVGNLDVSLPETGKNASVTVKPARLSWDETLQIPEGLLMTAGNIQVAERIETDQSQDNQFVDAKTPSEDQVFLLVDLSIENPVDEGLPTPRPDEAILTGNGSEWTATQPVQFGREIADPVSGTQYRSHGTVAAGESASGWLIYEVPQDVETDELTLEVEWSESFGETTYRAIWGN